MVKEDIIKILNKELLEKGYIIVELPYDDGFNMVAESILKLVYTQDDIEIMQPKCPICKDTGYYTYGGSFGGSTITNRCNCK